MKDINFRLGDLFRIRKEFLDNNQIPVEAGIEDNLSVGLLTRITIPYTEEHNELTDKRKELLYDDFPEEIKQENLYKILFPRIDQYFWFPEYKFIQMFEPLIKKNK